MTTLPNGAYHIYLSDKLPPLIVEVFFDWAYQTGEPHGKPLSNYKNARFVRLQEVVTPPLVIELD